MNTGAQHYGTLPADPSFCPLHTSSPIPQLPTCSGPGGRRPPGQRRASGCPPDSRRPPTAGGIRPSWPGFLDSPGQRPFLPEPLSSPSSYFPRPCNGPNGPKGLQSNKLNQIHWSFNDSLAPHKASTLIFFGKCTPEAVAYR